MRLGYYPIYKDGDIYTVNPFKYNKGKDQIQKSKGNLIKEKKIQYLKKFQTGSMQTTDLEI